jgi:hypothetical protein
VKNPDVHVGDEVLIYGQVTQFDSATGTEGFLADSGATKKFPEYGYVDFNENTVYSGDEADLEDVVEGDLFTAYVTVVGSYS